MKRFEYKVETCKDTRWHIEVGERIPINIWLNELGIQGWELVIIYKDRFIFKKEIK